MLTETQKAQILILDREGKDYREIATIIAASSTSVLYFIFKNAKKELDALRAKQLESGTDA